MGVSIIRIRNLAHPLLASEPQNNEAHSTFGRAYEVQLAHLPRITNKLLNNAKDFKFYCEVQTVLFSITSILQIYTLPDTRRIYKSHRELNP